MSELPHENVNLTPAEAALLCRIHFSAWPPSDLRHSSLNATVSNREVQAMSASLRLRGRGLAGRLPDAGLSPPLPPQIQAQHHKAHDRPPPPPLVAYLLEVAQPALHPI